MPDAEPSPSALSALRILDLSTGIAGGYCTKLLADYGAEVVKVEMPGTGDSLRQLGPFPEDDPDIERGLLHWYLNANKRGITLDVTNPAGRTILQRLLPHFDIVVKSFLPPQTRTLDLSYQALRGDQHDLIWLSVPNADPDKRWELSSYFNGVNRNKHGITLNLQDPRGIALYKRLVTIGDVVVKNYTPRVMENFGLDYPKLRAIKSDIIMLSLSGYGGTGPWRDYAAFAFPVEDMSGFPQMTGYGDDDTPRRWGNSGVDAISGLTGAYAVLTALEHRRRTGQGQRIDLSMVEALTSFLGGPILDYQVNHRLPERQGNHQPAHAPHSMYPCQGEDTWVSIAVTSEEEWHALCTTMGRVDWLTDPRFADPVSRHQHQAVLDEATGVWTQQHDWAHFSETLLSLRRPAPLLGEHNAFVLKELLGLSDAELDELEQDKVVGTTFVGSARL